MSKTRLHDEGEFSRKPQNLLEYLVHFRIVALRFHLVIRFVLPQELQSRSGGVNTLCCSFPKALSHNRAREPTGKGERGKECSAIPLGLSESQSDCQRLQEMCTYEKGGKPEEKKGNLWGHFRVETTTPHLPIRHSRRRTRTCWVSVRTSRW